MKKLFEYAKRVSVGTWVRGILSLVSIVNMALAAFGKTPLNIEYGELYTAISDFCRRPSALRAIGRITASPLRR